MRPNHFPLLLSVFVLLGFAHANAQPAFRFAPTSPTGLAPYAVQLADMDGDGDLDFITSNIANDEFGTVSIAMNNGDGTFAAPADYQVGPAPTDLRVADFNGDGRPDVVCLAYLSGTHVNDLNSYVSVLINNGSGAVANRTDYSVGENSHAGGIEVGDYNGDGHIDFAVVSYGYGLHVYRNHGDGTFSLYAQEGSSLSHIASADFNNDGRLDLVVSNEDATQIYLNTGTGFAPDVYMDNYPDGVRGVATGDFDGDGKADFATSGRSLSVFRNLGNGSAFAKTSFPAGENQSGIKVADMDGDGKQDITISNYLANSVSVYSNDGSGGFADKREWGVGQAPDNHAVGDVNADGMLDIVAADSQTSQTTVHVVLNAGNRHYVARRDYGMPGAARGVAFADFNRDGYLDAVSGAYVSNQDGPIVFYGRANGSFADGVQVENWGNNIPTDVAVGDFNGDGWVDFSTSIFSPGNSVRVNLNRGDGTFSPSTVLAAGGNPSGLDTGDVNGDGKLDIINSNGSQLDNTVSVHLGNGNGTFQPQVKVPVGFRPSDVLLADFDKNGRSEVVVTHYDATGVVYFRPNEAGLLGAAQAIEVGGVQGNAVAADFDNDGWLDFMAAAGNAVLLRNNQAGGFAAPIATPVPAGFMAAADWDRDGLVDIVGTNGVANLALVGWNRGGGNFEYLAALPSGYGTERAGAADLDGDGLPEIVTCSSRARSLNVFQNITALPLALSQVVSRKSHGNAGTFDIPLPLTGDPGIESRSGGAYTLVATFSNRLSAATAAISSGHGSMNETSLNGNTIAVNLSGVTSGQTLTVTLNGVTDAAGQTLPPMEVRMRILVGDTTGNGLVNASDVAQAKANSGAALTESNFRADVTANGNINSSDVAIVKAASGQAVTARAEMR